MKLDDKEQNEPWNYRGSTYYGSAQEYFSGQPGEPPKGVRADRKTVFFCLLFLVLHEGLQLVPFVGRLMDMLPDTPYRGALMQLLWYAAMSVPLVLIVRKFLARDIRHALSLKKSGRKYLGTAFVCVLVGNLAVNLLLSFLGDYLPDVGNMNQEAIDAIIGAGAVFAVPAVCIFAPVLEELIFRVGLYGLLRGGAGAPKLRVVLAVAVSAVLFCLYHVWFYAIATGQPLYLLYGLQYLAASVGLAVLYEKSGSIVLPMLLHAIINTISTVAGLSSNLRM
ncbi:MAG: CPBP family intramembrane metalloprotease [Oscillospiraceae bacterium]|nr:CPBP family intramembrane metalloprotease [Oscillospiraceae bacterium]